MTGTTLLLRQVHPAFVQNGFPTSQAFRPTPKDQSLLSVYDGDSISPEAAWVHYTSTPRLELDGSMALTIDECAGEGLPVRPDPLPDFPEHAVFDFGGLSDGQCRSKSKKLQAKSLVRGWMQKTSAEG